MGGSRLGGTGGAAGSGAATLGTSDIGSGAGLDARLEALRAPSPEAHRFPTRPATLCRDVAEVPLDLWLGSAALGVAGRPMMEEYDKDLAAERGCNGGAGVARGSLHT